MQGMDRLAKLYDKSPPPSFPNFRAAIRALHSPASWPPITNLWRLQTSYGTRQRLLRVGWYHPAGKRSIGPIKSGAASSPTNVNIGRSLETGEKLLGQPPRPSSRISLTLVAMDGISGPLTGSPVAEVGCVAQSLRRSSVTVVGAVSNAL